LALIAIYAMIRRAPRTWWLWGAGVSVFLRGDRRRRHVFKGIVEFGVLIVIGFAFLRWSFDRTLARWGSRWGSRGSPTSLGFRCWCCCCPFSSS